MRKVITKNLLIFFGWLCIIFGLLGVVLPILPTTPFLILALALFSKSSPRFHQMLLNNAWFGPVLREWEESKSISRQAKYKAYLLIFIAFSMSIALLSGAVYVQLLLLVTAPILVIFIWRIKEKTVMEKCLDEN